VKTAVAIRILGQTLTVRSDATAEEALQVADYVNRQLEEIGRDRTVDTLQLAVMALLNVSGSYLRMQRQVRTDEQALEETLQRWLMRLESAGQERNNPL